ncbi:JmjC domain-containing protein [Saccharothrix deserti]|uniref:JmjC domain-containing protein n=1 Tax=Saccharothrix deserti TaxID=2593674 RepID=UPI00131C028C|nr:cupin domain-containing protein [Saccharothrix deserti]
MDHRLVRGIEDALGWLGPGLLGREFARGTLPEVSLGERLLTPVRLLDLIMRRSMTSARLRCLQDGSDVHPQAYLMTKAMRRAEAVQMVDMARLGRLLKEGATLVLDAVNTYDATLEVACRALQWWARELVQVNTYLTTGSAAGFQLHWDDHDVIIVQVAGQKSWEVRGLARPVPMYRDAEPNQTPPEEIVWQGTMQPGDVMHIPRGYWHQATREDHGDGYSLHLTFGFPQRTGVDYLTWLADQSRRDEVLRHDIARWDSVRLRGEQQLAFTDAAVKLAATSSVDDYLAGREQELPAARHVVTHGLFGSPREVVCVTEFPPHIEELDGTVSVSAAARRMTFPVKALPALRPLLGGQPVNLDQLTAVTGVNAHALAGLLIAEDICAEVTPDLAAGYQGLLTGVAR